MSTEQITLLWFRDDLRVTDHPALTAAHADGDVVALWIRESRDDDGLGPRPLGEAASWWVHESLQELHEALHDLGIPLLFAAGQAATIVPNLARSLGAEAVRWSRRYAPRSRELDSRIKTELNDAGIAAHSHPGHLLVEPWQVAPASASDHYQVFTPFWKAARELPVEAPLPTVEPQQPGKDLRERIDGVLADHAPDDSASGDRASDGRPSAAGAKHGAEVLSAEVADLGLLDRAVPAGGAVPEIDSRTSSSPRPAWWETTLARHWAPGCASAQAALESLGAGITDYGTERDLPGRVEGTSRMSPRLRFGEISPRQLFAEVGAMAEVGDDDREAWVRQLYWREFSWHLTFHLPDLDWQPIRPEFANFPYQRDPETLRAWQRGRTGIALVDAGMRQLWETGWMHNRVRMVTASLLTKNLLQPWQLGEQWFWNTLVDADEANNPVSWQWVAGCGADASPFFRIFNPERQRERFDPDGEYVRQWGRGAGSDGDGDGVGADGDGDGVGADGDGADLAPIVDLGESRLEALDAYEAMKNA
ncbi:MAG: cryptochrome/photolyase family protein [Brevibacterium sp.]